MYSADCLSLLYHRCTLSFYGDRSIMIGATFLGDLHHYLLYGSSVHVSGWEKPCSTGRSTSLLLDTCILYSLQESVKCRVGPMVGNLYACVIFSWKSCVADWPSLMFNLWRQYIPL